MSYRTDSIMRGSQVDGEMPNWFLFIKMVDCKYCTILAPHVNELAR